MENATKALLIAGTVLIAIIMVSTALYLYTLFSNQTKEYNEIISATEIQKFNSKFDVYVGRTDITVQELVSVINLAKEYDYQIQIYLDTGLSPVQFNTSNTQEDFIKSKQDKLFSCKASFSDLKPNPEYDENGRITKLRFTQN